MTSAYIFACCPRTPLLTIALGVLTAGCALDPDRVLYPDLPHESAGEEDPGAGESSTGSIPEAQLACDGLEPIAALPLGLHTATVEYGDNDHNILRLESGPDNCSQHPDHCRYDAWELVFDLGPTPDPGTLHDVPFGGNLALMGSGPNDPRIALHGTTKLEVVSSEGPCISGIVFDLPWAAPSGPTPGPTRWGFVATLL